MNLNIGDIVTLNIGKIAHGGHFISRHNNQVVFVRHGISGEIAKVKITSINSKLAFGDAVEILKISKDRVKPPCKYSKPGGCGGCDFQHISPKIQKKLKTTFISVTHDQGEALAISDRVAVMNNGEIEQLETPDNTYKLPKNDVKTLLDTSNNSDTTYSVRRTFVGTTNGSSIVTFTSGANETFASYSDAGYTCSIMTASGTGGAAAQGDIVALSASILGGEGTNTLTVTDTSGIKDAAQIKLIATVLRSVATHKAKTSTKCKTVTIAKDGSTSSYTSDIYGARVIDQEIGLTYADAYKLRAVYESTAIATAPSIPTLTIANRSGAFTAGETFTGSASAAKGVVIDNTTTTVLTYVVTSGTFNTSDTITGGTSSSVATILQTNVTQGYGAKLWSWGDRIGSVQKLKMQDVGHNFEEGGIGNYKQNALLKDVSSALVTETTVTASLTGSSGTVHTFDGDKNILSLKNVKGIFNDDDYCTTSDSKNFVIGKINPCTARGKVGGSALLDGNYTNDTGFPSVDAMRIHDGAVYQDFSYKIKVGRSINDYRSIVKSLLSPAGTIFFGEVSIRQLVDGSAAAYNVNFDGLKTTKTCPNCSLTALTGLPLVLPSSVNISSLKDFTTRRICFAVKPGCLNTKTSLLR